MKRNYLIFSIIAGALFGMCFAFSNSDSGIITSNIEALTATYEWRPAQNGTWNIPIEMGESPTAEFKRQHPTWTYHHAPTGTRSYSDLQFWNLGESRWETLYHCAGTEDWFFPEAILNGQYCYARFSGNPSYTNGCEYGNMYKD